MSLRVLLFFILVIIGFFVAANVFRAEFNQLFIFIGQYFNENVPWLLPMLDFLKEHLVRGDIIGIGVYAFTCVSPVSPIPLEPYILYVKALNVNSWTIILFFAFFSTMGTIVNYIIGRIFGERFIARFLGDIPDWEETLLKHVGALLAFLSALLPLPDITSLLLGANKVPLKWFAIFTFLGRLLRVYMVLFGFEKAVLFLQNITASVL